MQSRPPARILAAAVGLVLLAGVRPGSARTLVADPAANQGAQVAGNAIDLTRGGLRIRVEPLASEEVADWFRTHTRSGQMALPLADEALGPAPAPATSRAAKKQKASTPLTVFSVALENRSGSDVLFVPEMASLVDEHETERSAVPGDVLHDLLRTAFSVTQDPDAAADDAIRAIHADPLVLKHGQLVSRLMIFPPDPQAKRATLLLRHVAVGAKDVDLAFSFAVAQ